MSLLVYDDFCGVEVRDCMCACCRDENVHVYVEQRRRCLPRGRVNRLQWVTGDVGRARAGWIRRTLRDSSSLVLVVSQRLVETNAPVQERARMLFMVTMDYSRLTFDGCVGDKRVYLPEISS